MVAVEVMAAVEGVAVVAVGEGADPVDLQKR
jgi:hypothetical protein